MRQIAAEFSALPVTEIARTVCELLEWKRPNMERRITSAGNCWSVWHRRGP